MKTPEQTNPQFAARRRSVKKMLHILICCMVGYVTILFVLSSGRFTPMQVWFGVQILNSLGFFLGLAAFIKVNLRN